MTARTPSLGRTRPRPTSLALALALGAAMGCDPATAPESPMAPADAVAGSAAATGSAAPFVTWHQGFNHGTAGWFGAETPGPMGWCGAIEQVGARSGAVMASAGGGYAIVSQGGCNPYYADLYGPMLRGAPWAPGPDGTAFSSRWPTGGYVVELDIHLDPSWTAAPLDEGAWVFGPGPEGVSTANTTVFIYSASLMHLATGSFTYFAVPVEPGNDALSVLGHPVAAAGWYTFRFAFADRDGQLAVTFALDDRHGRTLFTEEITETFFGLQDPASLVPADFGSGYVWFASISPGLELPIDEYRVRRGR